MGKLIKKIDKFMENLGTCPNCKHNSAEGIRGCDCEDKHCTCNPINKAWS